LNEEYKPEANTPLATTTTHHNGVISSKAIQEPCKENLQRKTGFPGFVLLLLEGMFLLFRRSKLFVRVQRAFYFDDKF